MKFNIKEWQDKYLNEIKSKIVINEATSFKKENDKLKKSLEAWIKYSMENGDSEADILSVLEEYAIKIINKR